jgi:hypothetical protein
MFFCFLSTHFSVRKLPLFFIFSHKEEREKVTEQRQPTDKNDVEVF